MPAEEEKRLQGGSAVLDIGDDIGALIIYTRAVLHGAEIEVSPKENRTLRVHSAVLERAVAGRTIYAALFLALPADDYVVWCTADMANEVRVAGGQVAELDWRELDVALLPKDASTDHESLRRPAVPLALLPPRYRSGRAVSAAPMGSAPMRFDAQGEVAWDQMWTDFCDLALAGGPPHRDTILRPGDAAAIAAAPEAYTHVVAEIERGLKLVTTLPVLRDARPGWVGLCCLDEEMARWLHMAIEVENIAVQREGTVLYLPAGPDFRREQEIKNVVTVVAKTHHYWTEHRYG